MDMQHKQPNLFRKHISTDMAKIISSARLQKNPVTMCARPGIDGVYLVLT